MLRKRNEAAKDVEQALAAAVEPTREFARLRDEADEAAKRVKEACNAVGDEPPFPELDEPEFRPNSWPWLLELVQLGPKQPLATAAEQRRERDKRRKRHDEEMLAEAERAGGIYIGGFPDRLRPEAERRLERARQRLDAERQAIRRLNQRGVGPTTKRSGPRSIASP